MSRTRLKSQHLHLCVCVLYVEMVFQRSVDCRMVSCEKEHTLGFVVCIDGANAFKPTVRLVLFTLR